MAVVVQGKNGRTWNVNGTLNIVIAGLVTSVKIDGGGTINVDVSHSEQGDILFLFVHCDDPSTLTWGTNVYANTPTLDLDGGTDNLIMLVNNGSGSMQFHTASFVGF